LLRSRSEVALPRSTEDCGSPPLRRRTAALAIILAGCFEFIRRRGQAHARLPAKGDMPPA
jgi:hypothetical protein